MTCLIAPKRHHIHLIAFYGRIFSRFIDYLSSSDLGYVAITQHDIPWCMERQNTIKIVRLVIPLTCILNLFVHCTR